MKTEEEKIIQQITDIVNQLPGYSALNTEKELNELIKESLGTASPEFINHPVLNVFIKNEVTGNEKNYFMIWIYIENYISNHDMTLAQEKLNLVEEAIKQYLEKSAPLAKKAMGIAMPPKEIVNPQFIKKLYSLNDENLSRLFLKYFPAPRASIFSGKIVPEIISRREQAARIDVVNVLKRNAEDLVAVESKLTNMQRRFRATQRRHENIQRLPFIYKNLWQGPNFPEGITPEYAEQLLTDTNIPYRPQCDAQLAERIMNTAKGIELFSTVRHLTSPLALESIFNDGLLGRRSLIQFYMLFNPAALNQNDIEHGDANVVCLGANAVDPQAKHGAELIFDAKKIAQKNPCFFYKQRDLGYDPETIRNLKIGDLDLSFSHTGRYRLQPSDVSSFLLYKRHPFSMPIIAFSILPKALLIADNFKEMHRILTLNFFRFIDRLVDLNEVESIYKKIIYDALAKLNDEQLSDTLLQIGKQMTDTMEFNFYGAHRIDFSTLLTIKKDEASYTLNLQIFIDELKAGNLEKLHEAMEKIPEIFNSYRFIDYLLSITENTAVILELNEQRKKCTFPSWMEFRHTVQATSSTADAGTSAAEKLALPSSAPHSILFQPGVVNENGLGYKPNIGGEPTHI